MELNNKQKSLIEHALKGEVPFETHEDLKKIKSGKLKIKVPKTIINIIDDDTGIINPIQFTDNKINQVVSYFIKNFGIDFGILYWSASQGKEEYEMAQEIIYSGNFENENNKK